MQESSELNPYKFDLNPERFYQERMIESGIAEVLIKDMEDQGIIQTPGKLSDYYFKKINRFSRRVRPDIVMEVGLKSNSLPEEIEIVIEGPDKSHLKLYILNDGSVVYPDINDTVLLTFTKGGGAEYPDKRKILDTEQYKILKEIAVPVGTSKEEIQDEAALQEKIEQAREERRKLKEEFDPEYTDEQKDSLLLRPKNSELDNERWLHYIERMDLFDLYATEYENWREKRIESGDGSFRFKKELGILSDEFEDFFKKTVGLKDGQLEDFRDFMLDPTDRNLKSISVAEFDVWVKEYCNYVENGPKIEVESLSLENLKRITAPRFDKSRLDQLGKFGEWAEEAFSKRQIQETSIVVNTLQTYMQHLRRGFQFRPPFITY